MEQNKFFPEIKGNFGFGCMRLPMIQGDVDLKQMEQMQDNLSFMQDFQPFSQEEFAAIEQIREYLAEAAEELEH